MGIEYPQHVWLQGTNLFNHSTTLNARILLESNRMEFLPMNFEFEFLIEKPLNENSNASFYTLVY